MQKTVGDKNTKLAIMVLGMHRSGTSAVTRIINLHGVDISARLEEPNEFNEKGYWESEEIMLIHDELLAELGSAWMGVGSVSTDALQRIAKPYQKRLLQVLQQDFSESEQFLVKDPRICRVFPIWQPILAEFNATPVAVVPFRHPMEVADSLAARNDMSHEQAFAMWLRHILDAEELTRGMPRCFIGFNDILKDWHRSVQRIQSSLGISFPEQSDRVAAQIDEFLTPELKHFQHKEIVESHSLLHELVKEAYGALEAVQNEGQDLLLERFAAIAERFNPIINTFAPAFDNLDRRLMARDAECRVLNEQYDVLASQQRQLQKEFDHADKEWRKLIVAHQTLEKNTKDTYQHARNLELLTEDLKTREAKLSKQVWQQTDKIGALEAEKQEVIQHRDQLQAEIQSLSDQRQQLQLSNTEMITTIGEHHHMLAEKDNQIEQITSSNSYRIMAPLRFIRRNFVSKPLVLVRQLLSHSARHLWLTVPLSMGKKQKLKSLAYSSLPMFFRHTKGYSDWYSFSGQRSKELPSSTEPTSRHLHQSKGEFAHIVPSRTERNPQPFVGQASVKTIAFYLPQFHAIPENDEWWGEGFTEWTNVQPAQAAFEGHYQPHKPDELGYYNLLDKGVQAAQIEIAKLYGLGGFCFYFYWFSGTRLLEQPILNYLDDSTLDFPFCLCWANESWSRRWDGLDSEVLIDQNHSAEDDIAFITYLKKYFNDPRYIRVENKPLLLVYRPGLLPDIKATARRWRKWCRDNGVGEIYLAYTQSFDKVDPAKYGFDAAIEFPPNNSSPPDVTASMDYFEDDYAGVAYDWNIFVKRSRNYETPDYKLFRGVNPAWDNSARRKNGGAVFLNSNPAAYKEWLENAAADTIRRFDSKDEQLVFINAWNEWAEGAHLEPDQAWGYSYLQATRDALSAGKEQPKVLLVAHDAHPHGAQLLVLNFARQLAELEIACAILCLGEGELLSDYQSLAITKLHTEHDAVADLTEFLADLTGNRGFSCAVVNSVASGHVAQAIQQAGFQSVGLVHELPKIIRKMGFIESAKALAHYTQRLVFPAAAVSDGFESLGIQVDSQTIQPQGLYKKNKALKTIGEQGCRQQFREQFDIPSNSKIVLSIGGADYRKGFDLFLEAAERVIERNQSVYFVWAGKVLGEVQGVLDEFRAKSRYSANVFVTDCWVDTDLYYAGADVFALTSREDPFPSVVLESFEAGLPVVGFDQCGGFADIVTEQTGSLIAPFDVQAYVTALSHLLDNKDAWLSKSASARQLMEHGFSFRNYVLDVVNMAGLSIPKVSVVLPNYNYGHLIASRINNILKQGRWVYELIILDDASTDNSTAAIEQATKNLNIPVIKHYDEKNSGSVFKQWRKGVDLARGDFIWIAEADDIAAENFLAALAEGMQHNKALSMAYCQSRQVDENGQVLANDYKSYTDAISAHKWNQDYSNSGIEEMAQALSVKNTIPNVSAVLFRAESLKRSLEALGDDLLRYKVAGDWLVYLEVLSAGGVLFKEAALNDHRRHASSVTAELDAIRHVQEVRSLQFIAGEKAGCSDTAVAEEADAYIEHLLDYFDIGINLTKFDELKKQW